MKRHPRTNPPQACKRWSGVILMAMLLGCSPPKKQAPAPPQSETPGAPAALQSAPPNNSPAPTPAKPSTSSVLEWRFTRDERGLLKRLSAPGGKETSFDYVAFPDHPEQIKTVIRSYPGGQNTCEFDRAGRRTNMRDAAGEIQYTWDGLGRLAGVRGSGYRIDYQYDSQGRRKSYSLGSGKTVAYTYDFLGRIESMSTPAGTVAYEYQAGQGKTIRTLPNGVFTIWETAPDGALRSITHAGKDQRILARFLYAYRPDGSIERIEELKPDGSQNVINYEYDRDRRLTGVRESSGGKWRAQYDAVGNRIEAGAGDGPLVECRYDWAGRPVSVAGVPCASDAAGNLTQLTLDGRRRQYEYDHANRLVRVDGGEVVYEYDGDGAPIARTVRGERAAIVAEPQAEIWQPLLVVPAGGAERFYLWDGRTPLGVVENGRAVFFLDDHLGSVRLALDARGQVTRQFAYDPYGAPAGRDQAADFAPGYAGLFWDPAAQICASLGRAYHPGLGRWLQVDPVLRVPGPAAESLTLYAYCAGDPLNYVDRSGGTREEFSRNRRWETPNLFSAIQADLHRSVANSVNDAGLRQRAQAGEAAYERANSSGQLRELTRPRTYDENRMTIFVRAMRLDNLAGTAVPHTGIHFGSGLDVGGLRLDGVELQNTKIGGREGRTVIAPMNLRQQEPGGAIQLKPLETSAVRVNYENRIMPIKELPAPKKAEIQSNLLKLSLAEMGKTRGDYQLIGRGQSNQCVDLTLSLLDRAVEQSGVRFQNGTYRERFTARLGGTAAANPTVFGGLALALPRVQDSNAVWWSTFLRDFGAHALDTRRAKETLAGFSESHIANARGAGVAAGLTASALDLIGGYIPGEGGNRGQQIGSAVWGVALGPAGAGRTLASVGINLNQGHPVKAGVELALLGAGGWVKARQAGFDSTPILEVGGKPSLNNFLPLGRGQMVLPYAYSPETQGALRDVLQNTGQWVQAAKYWNAAYKLSGLELTRQLAPSPVGGVYLGGAGKALESLGRLAGVAFDERTGKLVLIAEQGGSIGLPPLRLDDVVTVFRSVYQFGEGPSVSIDPDRANPHGPTMVVVHGKATPDTYVGWVLFEADRIMKCYTLGRDNLSGAPFRSAVPGFDRVLDTLFFGGGFADGGQPNGLWERFWIVPARVERFNAAARDLTLFDLPLKVKTQKMILRDGKLVDDPEGKSSPGALAFIDWFTTHYDAIADECLRQPPKETGHRGPVPVFAELRRIALLTAIAEQLRDQGVPMPPWMGEREIARIPVDATTPALTEAKNKTQGSGTLMARIYGGVNLSPADAVVETYDGNSKIAALAPPQREKIAGQLAAAEALAREVRGAAAATPMLAPFALQSQGRAYQAVALPGADARAFLPCRLDEIDLDISGEDGVRVTLNRHYNSFFQPAGPWGKAWTMDLPRLEEVRVPTGRTDYGVQYRIVTQLTSPLNTVMARFSKEKIVDPPNSKLWVPDRPCEIQGLGALAGQAPGQLDRTVFFKDGRAWRFDEKGRLIAEEAKPYKTVYLRDTLGNLIQIAGFYGAKTRAIVNLKYDRQGRLESAEGENGGGEKAKIQYAYNPEGMLQSALFPEGKFIYDYERSLVKKISWSARGAAGDFAPPKAQRQFDYDANGQLVAEILEGARKAGKLEQTTKGFRISVAPDDDPARVETALYDDAYRPLEMTGADNTRTRWEYPAEGGVKTETVFPGGERLRTTLAADGRRKTTENPDQTTLDEAYDASGRLTAVSLNGAAVLRQQWHPNGWLRSIDYETHSLIPKYDEEGRLTAICRAAPAAGDTLKYWEEFQLDGAGRVVGLKDYSGAEIQAEYDASGALAACVEKRDGQNYGLKVRRDGQGRIVKIESSWGDEEISYDATGQLKEILIRKGPQATARAEYENGRMVKWTGFDGASIAFNYDGPPEAEGAVKSVLTAAIAIGYESDPSGKIKEVKCGEDRRVELEYGAEGELTRLTVAGP